MPDHHPRYVTTTDGLWILDRWYCHLEVYRTPHRENKQGGYVTPLGAREQTAAICDSYNAEHDAWLAAG